MNRLKFCRTGERKGGWKLETNFSHLHVGLSLDFKPYSQIFCIIGLTKCNLKQERKSQEIGVAQAAFIHSINVYRAVTLCEALFRGSVKAQR